MSSHVDVLVSEIHNMELKLEQLRLQIKADELKKQIEDEADIANARQGAILIRNQKSVDKIKNLPPNITAIACDYNAKITYLPDIPEGITILRCSYNDLTQLPKLPTTLTYLDCLFNEKLTCLPDLPEGLKMFFWGFSRELNKLYPELDTLYSCAKFRMIDGVETHDNIKEVVAYVNKINAELRAAK